MFTTTLHNNNQFIFYCNFTYFMITLNFDGNEK